MKDIKGISTVTVKITATTYEDLKELIKCNPQAVNTDETWYISEILKLGISIRSDRLEHDIFAKEMKEMRAREKASHVTRV